MVQLGEAIKQSKFKSEKEKVTINLLYTSNWLSAKHNTFFKPYNILAQHYNVLRILYGQFPNAVSPGYVLSVMLDKKRDLTRLIDKLVKLGYASRSVCEDNRRKMDISITERGKEVVESIRKELDAWTDNNLNLSIKEAEILSDLLDKMRS